MGEGRGWSGSQRVGISAGLLVGRVGARFAREGAGSTAPVVLGSWVDKGHLGSGRVQCA